jgi:hypothetical protein
MYQFLSNAIRAYLSEDMSASYSVWFEEKLSCV